jgi:hypothetical protein
MSKRRNGECSIFPYRTGYAAYAWVTTPDGERKRKWVYGRTHEEVHGKWIKLQARAEEGPVPTTTPTLAHYVAYWLRKSSNPTSHRRQLRSMPSSSACTLSPAWAACAWSVSRSVTSVPG